MKLNTSTTILIIILLLIIYLLDNIKSFEDNLLPYSDIKTEDLKSRKKYFQKIHFKTPTVYKKEETENTKENIEINDILKINNNKINIEIPLEKSKPKQDQYVVIPSMDKYISGEKGLGDTVMMVKSESKDELPVQLDFDKIFSQ